MFYRICWNIQQNFKQNHHAKSIEFDTSSPWKLLSKAKRRNKTKQNKAFRPLLRNPGRRFQQPQCLLQLSESFFLLDGFPTLPNIVTAQLKFEKNEVVLWCRADICIQTLSGLIKSVNIRSGTSFSWNI